MNVRDKFPIKSFRDRSQYTQSNFVDHPMYYSVIDADTQERVIDYDKYTRISCNGLGHYFDFDFGCLSVDRIYYFEIRVESPSQVILYEDNVRFKGNSMNKKLPEFLEKNTTLTQSHMIVF